MIVALVCAAAVGFASFDVWWFVRWMYVKYSSKWKRPLNITDASVIKSTCWTTDIDYFGHMNNSKYLRELDFGR